jgi:hypothetical protein
VTEQQSKRKTRWQKISRALTCQCGKAAAATTSHRCSCWAKRNAQGLSEDRARTGFRMSTGTSCRSAAIIGPYRRPTDRQAGGRRPTGRPSLVNLRSAAACVARSPLRAWGTRPNSRPANSPARASLSPREVQRRESDTPKEWAWTTQSQVRRRVRALEMQSKVNTIPAWPALFAFSWWLQLIKWGHSSAIDKSLTFHIILEIIEFLWGNAWIGIICKLF